MAMTQEQIVDTVFKRSDTDSGENFTKDNLKAFNILMAIDGTRSVSQIAKDDFYEIDDLVEVVQQMFDQGIIEPAVTDASGAARKEFLQILEGHLGQIMGPVSGLLIEEKISDSGYHKHDYPMGRAHELIDQLSQAIGDESAAQSFKRTMTEELKKLS